MLTLQQIFDKALEHLNEQGRKRSTRGLHSRCAYRGEGGLKCAVGFFIPDDSYNYEWENIAVGGLIQKADFVNALASSGLDVNDYEAVMLLRGLQKFHDSYMTEAEYKVQLEHLKELAFLRYIKFDPEEQWPEV